MRSTRRTAPPPRPRASAPARRRPTLRRTTSSRQVLVGGRRLGGVQPPEVPPAHLGLSVPRDEAGGQGVLGDLPEVLVGEAQGLPGRSEEHTSEFQSPYVI